GWDFATGAMRAPRIRPPRAEPAPFVAAPVPPSRPPREDSPSLGVRLLGLPFLPSLWAQARRWRAMQVIGPVLLLAVLTGGALAVYRGWGMRGALETLARQYDSASP